MERGEEEIEFEMTPGAQLNHAFLCVKASQALFRRCGSGFYGCGVITRKLLQYYSFRPHNQDRQHVQSNVAVRKLARNMRDELFAGLVYLRKNENPCNIVI